MRRAAAGRSSPSGPVCLSGGTGVSERKEGGRRKGRTCERLEVVLVELHPKSTLGLGFGVGEDKVVELVLVEVVESVRRVEVRHRPRHLEALELRLVELLRKDLARLGVERHPKLARDHLVQHGVVWRRLERFLLVVVAVLVRFAEPVRVVRVLVEVLLLALPLPEHPLRQRRRRLRHPPRRRRARLRRQLGERLAHRSLILLVAPILLLLPLRRLGPLPCLLLPLESRRERRRVRRLIEPERPEIRDRQRPTRRLLELAQPLPERDVGDLDDLDDLGDASTKVVHPRREEEARSADACGTSTDVHPVPPHARDEADGVLGDFLSLVAEFEEGGEAGDVKGGVDGGELEGELFDELEVGRAEDEDVDLRAGLASSQVKEQRAHLEEVGKVDEHVARLVHPAGAVQARRNDVLGSPTLDKVHVDSEVEVALSGV